MGEGSFGEIDILHTWWGGQSCPQAGLPAGWTRWRAGPQAEKPNATKRHIFSCQEGEHKTMKMFQNAV
jgi:hypothetical protein